MMLKLPEIRFFVGDPANPLLLEIRKEPSVEFYRLYDYNSWIMNAENQHGLRQLAVHLRVFVGKFIPARNRCSVVDDGAKLDRARRFLDDSYARLGGDYGQDVTMAEIRDVLLNESYLSKLDSGLSIEKKNSLETLRISRGRKGFIQQLN